MPKRRFSLQDARELLPTVKRVTSEAVRRAEAIASDLRDVPDTHPNHARLVDALNTVAGEWAKRIQAMDLEVKALWLAALASLLTAASGGAAADETSRTTRTLSLDPRTRVVVESAIGDVEIAGWDRPELTVEIERRVPAAADLAALPAVIDEGAARVRIAALQVDEGKDARLRSTIRIKAPVAARFEAVRLFEGRLTLADLRGAITADVRRGPIDAARLAGAIRLESGIGDVTVRGAELTDGGLIRLRAFNGDVRLVLAAMPRHARVLALSLNGAIHSPHLPLTMKTGFGPRFGETTLGRGEPVVSIDVVTGDIHIEVTSR